MKEQRLWWKIWDVDDRLRIRRMTQTLMKELRLWWKTWDVYDRLWCMTHTLMNNSNFDEKLRLKWNAQTLMKDLRLWLKIWDVDDRLRLWWKTLMKDLKIWWKIWEVDQRLSLWCKIWVFLIKDLDFDECLTHEKTTWWKNSHWFFDLVFGSLEFEKFNLVRTGFWTVGPFISNGAYRPKIP